METKRESPEELELENIDPEDEELEHIEMEKTTQVKEVREPKNNINKTSKRITMKKQSIDQKVEDEARVSNPKTQKSRRRPRGEQ